MKWFYREKNMQAEIRVNEKKTFAEWFGSRKVQKALVIFAFMVVPMVLLFVFT